MMIVRNYVILRDDLKCMRKNSRDEATSNTTTCKRLISLVNVCLQYTASFSIFENIVKPITLLKYDNYLTIAKYRLAYAFRRTIGAKTDWKVKSLGGMWNTETDMCQQIANTLPEDVNISKHIFMGMLISSTCESLHAFDLHFNCLTFETYKE